MAETEPTKFYEHLEGTLKKFDAGKEILQKLRTPPRFIDYKPNLEAYVAEIRCLQPVVARKVDLRLRLTETDGAEYEQRFDTEWEAVQTEFKNWGLGESFENAEFINTGHRWVTVSSARFKSPYQRQAQTHLGEIKGFEERLREFYAPLGEVNKAVFGYDDILRRLDMTFIGEDAFEDVFEDERTKHESFKREFLADGDFVLKGILSLSMVHGLVYHLEKSSDLSRNHPGD